MMDRNYVTFFRFFLSSISSGLDLILDERNGRFLVKVKVIKFDSRSYKRISAGSNRSINIFLRMDPKEESVGGKYERRSGSLKPYAADPVCVRATFKLLKYPIYFH